MTISEMHSMFRTIGQMKGMQNIRGILPEEIDDYLNAAIIGFCREVLASGSATQYPDKVSQRDVNNFTGCKYYDTYKQC